MNYTKRKSRENLFKIIVVALSVIFSIGSTIIIFFVLLKAGYIQENNRLTLLKNKFLHAIFLEETYNQLIKAVAPGNEDSFSTSWDFDSAVALSKKIYIPTEMFGATKYRMRPNIGVYNVRVWTGLKYQALVLPKTPEITTLLQRNKVDNLVYFETDKNGFKKTKNMTDSDEFTVFFMGDSFTEGLWVPSEDTFSSIFGQHLKANGFCAKILNLGVNGYSVLESHWMLEQYAPRFHPKIILLNLFPNDVHDNYLQVIRGQDIPENNYQQMFSHIDQMHHYCEKNNIELMISIIPSKEQFNSSGKYSVFQDRVRAWSETKKITCFDPRSEFERIGAENIYLSWDPHFSRSGHKYYEKFIYDHIMPTIQKKFFHHNGPQNSNKM